MFARQTMIRTGLAAGVFAFASFPAAGQSATFTLVNGDGGGGAFNTTFFTLTADAGNTTSISSFALTVGDTQYLFDQLYLSRELFANTAGPATALLTQGDRTDDNAGPSSFAYAFTGLTPGGRFEGQWDIDNTNGDFNADARTILFSNGNAANAIVTLTFTDGTRLDYTLPDQPIADSYSFAIPTPGSGLLLCAGVMLVARRRKR